MSADDDAEWSAVDTNIDEEVATAMAITPQEVVVSGLPAFRLKHPGTCTGMYWRPHPPGAPEHRIPGSRAQRPPWPRNGSILIGEMHQLDRPIEGNHLWLEVVAYRPAPSVSDVRRAGGSPRAASAEIAFVVTPGCWMPFEQGGPLLYCADDQLLAEQEGGNVAGAEY
jgi:hypothetical protein